MLVHLSMFQKEFYNQYSLDFYPTPEALEPIIEQELKSEICGQIVAKIIEINKRQDWSKKVILITFKNGDRSILSAMTGTIDYRFYEIVDRETLQDRPYYKQIENAETSVVITGYVPRTEDVMYTLINTELQIDTTQEVTGPVDTAPVDATQEVTGPVDTTPVDTTPVDTAPVDTTPVDATQEVTGPVDATQEDTGPVDATQEDTTPVDATQEDTTNDE